AAAGLNYAGWARAAVVPGQPVPRSWSVIRRPECQYSRRAASPTRQNRRAAFLDQVDRRRPVYQPLL
ncbi:hypothetical protein ABTK02_19875, partial [Acinetobacter baumannii]